MAKEKKELDIEHLKKKYGDLPIEKPSKTVKKIIKKKKEGKE